jgi:hypothetical protein
LAAGYAGVIIQDILDNGFSLLNIRTFQLEVKQAEEFLEVYQGVLPEFHASLICPLQGSFNDDEILQTLASCP